MTIQFGQSDAGLLIRDTIEQAEYPVGIDAGRTVTPSETVTDPFSAPVDAVAAFDAHTLRFPTLVNIYCRDSQSGDLTASSNAGNDTVVPPGRYEVEVASAPIKLYFIVDAGLEIQHRTEDDQTEISFGSRRQVRLAARSHHEKPAGTITTTGTPEELMQAVSTFGTALKTHSPERSFPTLRGHPPRLETGNHLSIPDELRTPDTGIEIRVPPHRGAVFAVTPLAYYLGASVVPSTDGTARLRLEPVNQTVRLTSPRDGYRPATNWTPPSDVADTAPEIAEAANRLLSHTFTLDCAVRTEGMYDVDLSTRTEVLSRLQTWSPPEDLEYLPWNPSEGVEEPAVEAGCSPDLAALYEMPLAERTAAYLELPHDRFTDVLEWPFGTSLADIQENAQLLPETANKLAHVFTPPRSTAPPPELQADESTVEAVDSFTRSEDGAVVSRDSEARSVFPGTSSEMIISPAGGYIGQLWAADGVPVGSVKPSPVAHNRSLNRDPSESAIRILVVCNDEDMEAEAADLYGFRELLSFDITVAHNRSCEELREDLQTNYDLLHFIGHINDTGVRCRDGRLDIHDVENIEVDAFLLNGCRSYEQGAALIARGSLGGFVTTEDVGNRIATRVGRTLADLLDAGFPLYGALDVLRSELGMGSRYSVFGDPMVTLSPASGVPTLNAIDQVRDEEVWATALTYPTRQVGLGSMCSPAFGTEEMYLATGALESVRLPLEEAVSALQRDQNPILVGGELVWTNDADLEAILRAADSATGQSVQEVLSVSRP